MKLTHSFLMGLGALSLVTLASADQTIYITGATAFRSATLNTIKSLYSTTSGASFAYGHDSTTGSFTGAGTVIFHGKFQSLPDNTTICCAFTGSVEGIRALAVPLIDDPAPPQYYTTAASLPAGTSSGAESVGYSATKAAAASDIALSDVNKTATPFASAAVTGTNVGVIVFTMVSNDGSVIDNVTSQQYRAVLTDIQELALFTGNAANVSPVCAVGRSDASGTRTTYLAEIGYGYTNTLNQYLATPLATNATVTKLQQVPAGGDYKSDVWGQDVAGNGGYTSGGDVAKVMGSTFANAQIVDADNNVQAAAGQVDVISFLSVSDAGVAKLNGANIIKFNGVGLDMTAFVYSSTSTLATSLVVGKNYKIIEPGTTDFTLCGAANSLKGTTFTCTAVGSGTGTAGIQTGYTLSTADKNKVYNGSYTAWGYERMFRKTSVTSGPVFTVFGLINSNIQANLSTAGVRTTDMRCARTSDGGTVTNGL